MGTWRVNQGERVFFVTAEGCRIRDGNLDFIEHGLYGETKTLARFNHWDSVFLVTGNPDVSGLVSVDENVSESVRMIIPIRGL